MHTALPQALQNLQFIALPGIDENLPWQTWQHLALPVDFATLAPRALKTGARKPDSRRPASPVKDCRLSSLACSAPRMSPIHAFLVCASGASSAKLFFGAWTSKR